MNTQDLINSGHVLHSVTCIQYILIPPKRLDNIANHKII